MKVEYTILDGGVILQIDTEIPYFFLSMTAEEFIREKSKLKEAFNILDKDKRKEKTTIYIGASIDKNWKKRLTWNQFLKQIENDPERIWRNIKLSMSQSKAEVTGIIEVPVLKAEKLLLKLWRTDENNEWRVDESDRSWISRYKKLLVLLWICWKNEE